MNKELLDFENMLGQKFTNKLKEMAEEASKRHFLTEEEINEDEVIEEGCTKTDEEKSEEQSEEEKIEEAKLKIGGTVSVDVTKLDDKDKKKAEKLMKKAKDGKLVILSIDDDEVELGSSRMDAMNTMFVSSKVLEK